MNFSDVPIFFMIFAGIVTSLILIIFTKIIIKSMQYHNEVKNSPLENINSKVSSKRVGVSGGSGDSAAFTYYYITFENSSTHERIELSVRGSDYGKISEGDLGVLEHKGPKFISFNRMN